MGTKNVPTDQSHTQINGPRLVGEILHDYLENSNEPLAVAYREQSADADGWNRNTDLCMDVKTFLRSDRITKIGKNYSGVLIRDADNHYSFVETIRVSTDGKRNPHVYNGKYISVTRKDNGSYRPNFKPLKVGADFSVEGYAECVKRELIQALKGLVKESDTSGFDL